MSVIPSSPIRRFCDPVNISPGRKSLDAELYGLGHTIKHLQPPGGKENGVFDAYRLPPAVVVPKKTVKDNFKAYVFGDESPSTPLSRPITPALESTKDHVFPETPSKPTSARHNNMKSTLFDADPPSKATVGAVKRNPLTGESCKSFDDAVASKARRVRNPITFEGVPQKMFPSRCIQPPGGKSSLVIEYRE